MRGDKEGFGYAALVNRKLNNGEGLGLYIKFGVKNLPYLSEWKMLAEKDYVVGLEPANVNCKNRADLRKEGSLPFLKAGEKKDMFVEIGILEGKAEINNFEKKIRRIRQ